MTEYPSGKVGALFHTLMTAISNCSLYSTEHASVEEYLKRSLTIINEMLDTHESIEIMIIEDEIIINKNPLKETGIHEKNLIKRLKRKGISGIEFLKGLTIAELKQFIADISVKKRDIKSYPHIKTGVIDVRLGGLKIDDGLSLDTEGLADLSTQQVEKLKEVYSDISPFRRLNTSGLEEIVVNFILTFRREANILTIISPVKAYSEYTYTHATNVAVLSMFQAESLGITDELLHDIGISALLHDVGKMFISKEILEKKGSLADKEWEEMQRHSLYGARYLSKMEDLPRLAPVIALQHHYRYDSKGYPALHINGKRQHILSQIIAVSDFFDALRSIRPYKREWEVKEILSLMRKNADSEFNPLLVDNFTRIILAALKGS
ncbi:cyclic di-GMP phosphodiesterase response regulator RpfG [bacterium BMS3Abin07]|nr:cyclic di-GMP phosphodiesterase response regulator RpfG [bacterium BMS3Abin07]GBE32608.1 cyclic di-GMP phosphodiesterase response regulator RpfG [bacterium BMS3Bbin05]